MKDVKRVVSISFWDDKKVVDMFSAEDKYFYLYLLTNPYTTQLGIYRLTLKKAAFDLSWSLENVMVLVDRFQNKYDLIRYSEQTGEIAIKNYLRHSIIKGGKPVMDCLLADEKAVQDRSLLKYIYNNLKNKYIDNITVKDYIKHLSNTYINDNDSIVNDTQHDSCFEKDVQEPKDKPSAKDLQREADAMFESLWKLYPRKKGKGAVKDATKRKLYAIGFDRMKKAIERYKADVDGRDIQYIMYGSRFFNSGYVDYLDDENDHVEAHGGEVQVGIDGSILE